MVCRFRMIAGPNGSGKSTLVGKLANDYAVNFYEFLNADDILAAVSGTGAYSPRFPVDSRELIDYAESSTYDEAVKSAFRHGHISVDGDCVRFAHDSINSYTVALFTNFLQHAAIGRRMSFSQETVFSHPSKVAALRRARDAGYRTYLYYVATETPNINRERVTNRFSQGGHNVPDEKIAQRYNRSLDQVKDAMPFLSRAYFFDNSGTEMTYLGCYAEDSGYSFALPPDRFPQWFHRLGLRSRI